MHEHWGNSFFLSLGQEMISPYVDLCIGKCHGVCKFFLQNFNIIPKVYALSHSYLDISFSYAILKSQDVNISKISYFEKGP